MILMKRPSAPSLLSTESAFLYTLVGCSGYTSWNTDCDFNVWLYDLLFFSFNDFFFQFDASLRLTVISPSNISLFSIIESMLFFLLSLVNSPETLFHFITLCSYFAITFRCTSVLFELFFFFYLISTSFQCSVTQYLQFF